MTKSASAADPPGRARPPPPGRDAHGQPGPVAPHLFRHDHAPARALHRAVRTLEDRSGQVQGIPGIRVGRSCGQRLSGARDVTPPLPRHATDRRRTGSGSAARRSKGARAGLGAAGNAGRRHTLHQLVGPHRGPGGRHDLLPGRLRPALDPWDSRSSTLPVRCWPVTPTTSEVAGYTDNQPITGGPYANNWELSAARATTVVERLTVADAVAPQQVVALAYGEYHPSVPNTSPAAQAQNRTGQHRDQSSGKFGRDRAPGERVIPVEQDRRSHDFRRTDLLDRFHVHRRHGARELRPLATTPLSSVLRQQCAFSLVWLDQVTWR